MGRIPWQYALLMVAVALLVLTLINYLISRIRQELQRRREIYEEAVRRKDLAHRQLSTLTDQVRDTVDQIAALVRPINPDPDTKHLDPALVPLAGMDEQFVVRHLDALADSVSRVMREESQGFIYRVSDAVRAYEAITRLRVDAATHETSLTGPQRRPKLAQSEAANAFYTELNDAFRELRAHLAGAYEEMKALSLRLQQVDDDLQATDTKVSEAEREVTQIQTQGFFVELSIGEVEAARQLMGQAKEALQARRLRQAEQLRGEVDSKVTQAVKIAKVQPTLRREVQKAIRILGESFADADRKISRTERFLGGLEREYALDIITAVEVPLSSLRDALTQARVLHQQARAAAEMSAQRWAEAKQLVMQAQTLLKVEQLDSAVLAAKTVIAEASTNATRQAALTEGHIAEVDQYLTEWDPFIDDSLWGQLRAINEVLQRAKQELQSTSSNALKALSLATQANKEAQALKREAKRQKEENE